METITLSSFLDYFGTYYPILIPCITLLVILCSVGLDLLRVWLIAYVDEGQNGPYKTYVMPMLDKILNTSEALVDTWCFNRDTSTTLSIYCKEGRIESEEGAYSYPIGNGKYICFDYAFKIRRFKEVAAGKDSGYVQACVDICLKGERSKYFNNAPEKPKAVFIELVLWLLLGGLSLTCFKFLPTITMGVIVGYGVLRTARSIARLSKKFNKHCADGDAHKKEE